MKRGVTDVCSYLICRSTGDKERLVFSGLSPLILYVLTEERFVGMFCASPCPCCFLEKSSLVLFLYVFLVSSLLLPRLLWWLLMLLMLFGVLEDPICNKGPSSQLNDDDSLSRCGCCRCCSLLGNDTMTIHKGK